MVKYTCSKCDYNGTDKSNVKKHIKNKKDCYGAELIADERQECEICKVEFNDKLELKKHTKTCMNAEAKDDIMTYINELRESVKYLIEDNKLLKIQVEKLTKNQKKNTIEKEEDEEEEEDARCGTIKSYNSFQDNNIKRFSKIFDTKEADLCTYPVIVSISKNGHKQEGFIVDDRVELEHNKNIYFDSSEYKKVWYHLPVDFCNKVIYKNDMCKKCYSCKVL